jgi:predicted nucleotidyltransferase
VERALSALQDESLGFSAGSWYSERGPFARFVWPDWPEHLQKEIAEKIDAFHGEHPELKRIAPGTQEWQAIFRDWRADAGSALVIANAFTRHFPGRVQWVESEKDARGRIAAGVGIKDTGEIILHLFWRDSLAFPGPLSEADREAFQASVREVFDWATSRIRPILDTLRAKLQGLYGERFRGLYVYGSYARPDAGIELPESSDLDVALILSDFSSSYEEIKRFSDITYDFTLEHGLAVSVVPIRESDYKARSTNFIRTISEYAIPVK